MKIGIASIIGTTLFGASVVSAQPSPTQVERFDRQLETIRRNTRLEINPAIPPTQRMYFDYGGYISYSYLSLDSPSAGEILTTTAPDGSTTMTQGPSAHQQYRHAADRGRLL